MSEMVPLPLLDINKRQIISIMGDDLEKIPSILEEYDFIAGLDIRNMLDTFRFMPGERRLGELGPPQKTLKLNKRGRTLKITATMLIQSSCRMGASQ